MMKIGVNVYKESGKFYTDYIIENEDIPLYHKNEFKEFLRKKSEILVRDI